MSNTYTFDAAGGNLVVNVDPTLNFTLDITRLETYPYWNTTGAYAYESGIRVAIYTGTDPRPWTYTAGGDELPVYEDETPNMMDPGTYEYYEELLIPQSLFSTLSSITFNATTSIYWSFPNNPQTIDFSGSGRSINITFNISSNDPNAYVQTGGNSFGYYFKCDHTQGEKIFFNINAPKYRLLRDTRFIGAAEININSNTFYAGGTTGQTALFGAYAPDVTVTRDINLMRDIMDFVEVADLTSLYPQPSPTADELLQVESLARTKISLKRRDGAPSEVDFTSSALVCDMKASQIDFLGGAHDTTRITTLQALGPYPPELNVLGFVFHSPTADTVLNSAFVTEDAYFIYDTSVEIDQDLVIPPGVTLGLLFNCTPCTLDCGDYFVQKSSGSEILLQTTGTFSGTSRALTVPYDFPVQSLSKNIFTGVKIKNA